ncbi:MAG TPA: sulfotransferase, partial [Blastocatellia bacterium]|nr:sulfotransferase [Blastocatellia bacterium]
MRKLVAILHRLTGMEGHRFSQALGLLAEGQRRGMEVILFIGETADEGIRSALGAAARAVLNDPVFRADLSFNERTNAFVGLLERFVSAEVQANDLVLMSIATQCEARALSLWLRSLKADRKPFVVVLFVSDRWNRYGPSEKQRQMGEFAVLKQELSLLDPSDANRILFCAHTTGIANELSGILGIHVSVVPLTEVHRIDVRSTPSPAETNYRVPLAAMLGGARPEKGSERIPDIVNACSNRTDVRFLIQCANEQLPEEAFRRILDLAVNTNVELVSGALAPADYFHHLARADIVLLPYARTPYKQRPSAVFSEAVGCGKILVVPAGTWMAEQLEAGLAAGVVYQGDSTEAISEAVSLIVNNFTVLASNAHDLARAWTDRHSLRAFLDCVEAEIVSRPEQIAASPESGSLTDFSNASWRVTPSNQALDGLAMYGGDSKSAGHRSSGKIVFGCVAENNEKFLSRALRLLQSVRWFGGALANADFVVCVVNGAEPSYKSQFERLGASVISVPPFNRDNPFANKTQFFGLAELDHYDTGILLDCDTVVVGDPSPFLAPTKFQAKVADMATVPPEKLASLCEYFGIEQAEPLYRTTFGEVPTIWYCNSGVLICPLASISGLVSAWREYEMTLTMKPELLGPYLLHRGQAALALAFLTHPLPFDELPVAMNFPLHLTYLEPPRAMLETDPVILHYHDCLNQAGYLFPSPYPRAQTLIRRLNHRLRELRESNTNWRTNSDHGLRSQGVKQREGEREVARVQHRDGASPLPGPQRPGNSAARLATFPAASPAATQGESGGHGIVCVLGMHRSGTSLVTRLLNLLGVYLGRGEHMMPALAENPRGFWEHSLLNNLNNEILRRLGGSWDEVPTLAAGWERAPELSDLRRKASLLIQETFGGASRWGWKDPRNSLTLPFWRGLLPPVQYVVCLRNPIDTALSLQRRHPFSFEKCIDLWLAYVTAALEHTASQSRIIVFYEDFMDDWRIGLRHMAQFLGAGALADQPDVQMAAQEFVEQGLCHYRTSVTEVVDEPSLGFVPKALYLSIRASNRLANSGRAHIEEQTVHAALEKLGRSSVIAESDWRASLLKVGELGQELTKSKALTDRLSSALSAKQAQLDRKQA